MIAYQIKITEKNRKPVAWRRCQVPAGLTYTRLAEILLAVLEQDQALPFGFEFYHKKVRIQESGAGVFGASTAYTMEDAQTSADELMNTEEWFSFFAGKDGKYRIDIEKQQESVDAESPVVLQIKDAESADAEGARDALNQKLATEFAISKTEANAEANTGANGVTQNADEIAQVGLEKTACTIHTPIGNVRVNIPIPGVHMVLNALSAAAVGVELGLTPEQVKAGIEGFRVTKNRMSIETTKDGITILNDVYNSNPVSCKASLDILANAKGRRIAVLGFMGELGDYAEEGHREVGIHAAEKGIDVLYCIGLCCDYMADAAKKAGMKEVYYLETQEEFWEKGLPTLKAGDTILLKASRSREFEKTVAKLQGVN